MNIRRIIGRLVKSLNLRSRRYYGLDELDRRLLKHVNFRNGVFVEAGANNGIRQSNTYHLEKYRGWRGLLIEPIPELAAECMNNRAHSTVVNCALVDDAYCRDTIDIINCNLMSTVLDDRSEVDAWEHASVGGRVQGLGSLATVTVKARTLTSVIDECGFPRIDLLSLDVEGYEAVVLDGLDFHRFRPTFILIEVRNQEAIDRRLGKWYQPWAVLSDRGGYRDLLYKVKL